ncbi:uncharacterized protein BO87DRAFT_387459 [Aspergillus neoniger CBS 115656]|uniref:Uncharacterized protein n=1 Tax=Aspergillus neoniger (strain CBS 115656) TaxID=1448310 RepID=A0A318YH93_ASPNB|nr:hypothetical protein BO87DRAFT_387459 [Aspergillus neoniger CBS 115656]PYH33589.1 hypothetical protein BO87DRAFT_387459 [Aspergillus neoniger CBS 115656]
MTHIAGGNHRGERPGGRNPGIQMGPGHGTEEQGNQSIDLVSERQMMEGPGTEDKEHIPYLKTLSEAEDPYPKPLTEGDIRPGSPLYKLEKEDPKKHHWSIGQEVKERVVIHGDAARLRLPL